MGLSPREQREPLDTTSERQVGVILQQGPQMHSVVLAAEARSPTRAKTQIGTGHLFRARAHSR